MYLCFPLASKAAVSSISLHIWSQVTFVSVFSSEGVTSGQNTGSLCHVCRGRGVMLHGLVFHETSTSLHVRGEHRDRNRKGSRELCFSRHIPPYEHRCFLFKNTPYIKIFTIKCDCSAGQMEPAHASICYNINTHIRTIPKTNIYWS